MTDLGSNPSPAPYYVGGLDLGAEISRNLTAYSAEGIQPATQGCFYCIRVIRAVEPERPSFKSYLYHFCDAFSSCTTKLD